MSSNASLDESIDLVNSDSSLYIKIKSLSRSVSIYENEHGYYNYFVFFEEKSVGVVIGGCTELHWYLKPEYRGRGIMKSALRDYILPYLFEKCESIRITIKGTVEECSFDESLALAKSLGFIEIPDAVPLIYSDGKRDLELELTKEYFDTISMNDSLKISQDWFSVSKNTSNVLPVYFQFIVLWISFNTFYSAKFKKGRDSDKVKEFYNDSSAQTVYSSLFEIGSQERMGIISEFKETNASLDRDVVFDMRFPRSKEKAKKFVSENSNINNFFDVVYQIRCNLFHGGKEVNDGCDEKLVAWAYKYLDMFWSEYLREYRE